jgi:hypothetical protein
VNRSLRSRPRALAPGELRVCAGEIEAAADDVFGALARMGTCLSQSWSAVVAANGFYDTGDIAGLQTAVFETLDAQPAFESAGYVLTEGTLADRARHLDWWHRSPGGGYEFLLLNLDPDATDCYDYYTMEWFAAAVDGHRRFVSGPLIDLPCADVYIMTFSSPVVADGRLLGISGADVAVSRFEHRIMPPLRRLPVEAVLINRERRVIASNHARFTTGEKLPSVPGTDTMWRHTVPVAPDIGWVLAADCLA